MIKEVYFVRHSKPLKVNNDKNMDSLQIQNEKQPLSIEGENIAREKLNIKELKDIDKLYSSSYVRAISTAKYIAENNNITRQAVRDIIKKGEKKLFKYEEKLLFMKRMLNQEKTIQHILSELTKIEKNSSDKKVAHILETIRKELDCLV